MKRDHRSALTLSLNLILVLSLIAIAAPKAAAFAEPRIDNTRNVSPDAPPRETNDNNSQTQEPWTVSYVLYDGVANAQPLMATRARTVSANAPSPSPPSPRAVSTAPMTAGEKFKLFAQRSFLSPGAYGMSVISGVYGEWTDKNNNHHHANPGDFAADSMTRAARSFAFRANANFFEKFMFPSLFKQDPRYHRSGKKGAGAKIGYAVTRLFITQGDRNGKNEFNVSFLAGGLAASGMANLWEREERQDLHHFRTRFTSHLGLTALMNILREFIGGQ